MADPKPWEKENVDFTDAFEGAKKAYKKGKKIKPKKRKKKPEKGQGLNDLDMAEQDAKYSDAYAIAQDRKKRQKKLAPYAKTGPGASKK